MRLVHHIRPWHQLAAFSLFGASLISGCGGGADTTAPVANNAAVPGAPAAQPGMHAQHGAAMPPGMAAVPGTGTTPAAGHGNPSMNPTMAMANAHGGNPAAAHGSATPPGMNAAAMAAAANAPAAAHGSATPPGVLPANVPGSTPAAAHGAATPPGANPAIAAGNTPAAAHGAATPPGGVNPAAVAGAAATPAAAHGAATPPGAVDPALALAAGNAPGNLAANPGGAAAANPGAINPGAPDGQGGQGGGNAISGEPGSIEYVISKLVAMAKAGDYTGIDSIVSDKAKGLAAEFRSQDLKPTQIECYKTTFDGMQGTNRRAAGGNGVQFTFKKGETTIQITLVKETGGIFKIKELQIRDGKVR